ncbi:MAG: hypothetical protein ABI707_11570 [Ferruginibacter sp.]
MKHQNNHAIALAACFYTKAEYDNLLLVSDDKKNMCDTYDEWLYKFMKMKEGMAAEGVFVTEIFINIDELQSWCAKNKVKNTGASRSRYVMELARKYDK